MHIRGMSHDKDRGALKGKGRVCIATAGLDKGKEDFV